MHSDEESYRGTLQARTVGGELHTVIVMRRGRSKNGLGRSWLASPTLFEWLALRRVPWGGVAQAEPGNLWFQDGRLIVEWLQHPLDDLVTTQRITLAPPDPWGLRRATITAAGWTRLAELTDVDQSRTATISPDFQPSDSPIDRRAESSPLSVSAVPQAGRPLRHPPPQRPTGPPEHEQPGQGSPGQPGW